METPMSLARASVSVTGALAAVSAVLAGAAIWLILTDPVTVAGTFRQGSVTSLVRVLAATLINAVAGLLAYL